MVRLVFRPYTQVRRSICTSESLRTSTRVSSGFILLKHSSPSFGSQRVGSIAATLHTNHDETVLRPAGYTRITSSRSSRANFRFHFAFWFREPNDSPTCWTPWSVFQDGTGRWPRPLTSGAYALANTHDLTVDTAHTVLQAVQCIRHQRDRTSLTRSMFRFSWECCPQLPRILSLSPLIHEHKQTRAPINFTSNSF